MTDKIDKNLAKLSRQELLAVERILRKVQSGDFTGLNLVRLKGYADIFRVRKGKLRVIFQQKDGTARVLSIERRSEKTYRDF